MLELREHSSTRYAKRTWENANSADLTVAFAEDFTSLGELLTHRAAGDAYVAIPLSTPPLEAAKLLCEAATTRAANSLNIAGNGICTLGRHGWTQESVNSWVFQVLRVVIQEHPIRFVRSGGQTGADIAGLVAAHALGIDCLGLFPKRFLQRGLDNIDVRRTAEDIVADIDRWVQALKAEKPL
ncbi:MULTISPECIES: hypothetical protein [Pseudomonas]|uniref:hypothetical protein n=1 Tax=Pseudomonas TaxID=286 RepID=UPI000B1EA05A|nr:MULTISPECIES: hypothetical protein [Pseudomonas]MDU4255617.1 hypothetical protein [Pseudomonas sp.]